MFLKKPVRISIPAAILILLFFAFSTASDQDNERRKLFKDPPEDCRIMMRWWWFGPAVTKPELEREMRIMKEGGIGGFEVQPVYPAALDDAETGIRNFPFLSEEFLEALRFTSDKARELGLRMDLTLGSGWPYGGAQVPVGDAAGMLRVAKLDIPAGAHRLALPAVGQGERLLAVFLCRTADGKIVEPGIRELKEIRSGAVMLPDQLQGPYAVLVFISSRSGMMVKRPAFGAEGFVLNHYDRSAVERYLADTGARLLQALEPNPPYAIFCDSLEVYQSDWTENFLEEFQKRRGYDLKPCLPALAFDLGSQTPAVRNDWARTLTEIFNDYFMKPLHDWAGENNTLFRVQGYGIPPATVASNAYADISEGEGSNWRGVSASRWASSANHLFGRTVTSSETWTWLHSPVFRATPLDMKAEANLHFLQGINQLIGHGWPYSPEAAGYPGWRFYAAGVFNEKNPWWIIMPDLARCLQRSSWMLRQGSPVNDIAFYLPVSDAYAGFRPGYANLIESLRYRVGQEPIEAVLDTGYNFDFFDDDVLRQIGGVDKGALVLGQNRYKAVVLPNVERIPLDTYRKSSEFVQSGGILIATGRQPTLAPGFRATESEHQEVSQISRALFSSASKGARFVENGKTEISSALREMLPPDVVFTPEAPGIGFVHRRVDDAEIYFLANTSNVRQTGVVSLCVAGPEAEWWDPMSGQISPVGFSSDDGESRTMVSLELEPYEGRFLVFARDRKPDLRAIPNTETEALDLSSDWQVAFDSTDISMDMEKLHSWTDDETTQYFSGVASYEKTVSVPESMLKPGGAIRLDFGEGHALEKDRGRSNGMRAWFEGPVREAAVVYVNGERAGSAWCPPYKVDVTRLLKPGENRIRIQVANTAVNHMAGRALPDYRLLNQRYGKRFDPQDMDKIRPIGSGILGPVRLVTYER